MFYIPELISCRGSSSNQLIPCEFTNIPENGRLEAQNEGLKNDFLFQSGDFQVPAISFLRRNLIMKTQ